VRPVRQAALANRDVDQLSSINATKSTGLFCITDSINIFGHSRPAALWPARLGHPGAACPPWLGHPRAACPSWLGHPRTPLVPNGPVTSSAATLAVTATRPDGRIPLPTPHPAPPDAAPNSAGPQRPLGCCRRRNTTVAATSRTVISPRPPQPGWPVSMASESGMITLSKAGNSPERLPATPQPHACHATRGIPYSPKVAAS
jgi:hypothetical protein